MFIIRSLKNKDNPFTQVSNFFINDNHLSFKSKALLIFLLSKPDSWCFNYPDILRSTKDGIESVKSSIRELISSGYISSYRPHRPDGKFDFYNYTVFESPIKLSSIKTTSQPLMDFPLVVKPLVVKPLVVNPTMANNKNKKHEDKTTTTSTKIRSNTKCAVSSPKYNKKRAETISFLATLGVINQESIIKKYGLETVIKYSNHFCDPIIKADNPTGLLVISIKDKWEINPPNSKKPEHSVIRDICISCHTEFCYLDFKHTRKICRKCEEKGK